MLSQNSESKQKVIVFGAHPDDPETGCGGLMALFSWAGCEVVAAYLTRGEAGIPGKSHKQSADIRTEEALKACAILNARAVFLGQIDGQSEVTAARYEAVRRFVEKEQPGAVFTHWPIDTHRDHRACSLLVYDAWLSLGRKFALFYYEAMTGQQSQNFTPTDYVNIGAVLKQKHTACSSHVSQRVESWYADTHGRMEQFRGLEFGCTYAEAFVHHIQSPDFPLCIACDLESEAE